MTMCIEHTFGYRLADKDWEKDDKHIQISWLDDQYYESRGSGWEPISELRAETIADNFKLRKHISVKVTEKLSHSTIERVINTIEHKAGFDNFISPSYSIDNVVDLAKRYGATRSIKNMIQKVPGK